VFGTHPAVTNPIHHQLIGKRSCAARRATGRCSYALRPVTQLAMMRSVETILAAVERLPATELEIDARSAEVRVGGRLVARIDLHQGRVVVHAPADVVPRLQRAFPSSRPAPNGIGFDLAKPSSCLEAFAAIRRRVNVQRLVWQFRGASP
jgi:radical SAM superfamily enzyme with C-terminal helix-hairpin-helix motif